MCCPRTKCFTLIASSVFLAAICLDNCQAFNLEPRLPLLYQGDAGSYFGYSVAAHMIYDGQGGDPQSVDKKPRIIVGAPKYNRRGAVYSCDIFGDVGRSYPKSHCKELPIPTINEDFENTTDMWLGVSVSSGHSFGVLACAHRFAKPDTIGAGNTPLSAQQLGLGACFKYTTNLEIDGVRLPCEGKSYKQYHQDFGLCQAGTSCHLSSKYDIQTIGAPGAKTWRGAAYSYLRRPNTQWVKEWVGTHTDANYPVENYAYLGMAVTTGNFFNRGTPAWAAGAPRANDTGAVLLFERNRAPNNNELELNRTIVGEQVASSFGYVVATVDINNDGLDDLVVGAPFYYEDKVGGAVYVFMNEGSPKFISQSTKRQKILGFKAESRFGFAITAMGDVDKDGFNDVAIGAPYEDDGVVYIYLGTADGLSEKPSQVIRANDLGKVKHLPTTTTTFGYSLSGGVDIDNNKYPDLVVGAYSSDRVFTIYSRPIKNIKAELRYIQAIDPKSAKCQSPKEICTTFEVCLTVPSSFEYRTADLLIVQTIEAETFQEHKKKSRVHFKEAKDTDRPHVYIRKFSLSDNLCTRGSLMLVDRSDIHNTIKMKLSLNIVDDLDTLANMESNHVVLIDKYPILNKKLGTLFINANFIKNCGDDEVCESSLKTTSKMHLETEKGEYVYYLGTENLNLTVSVENSGESAYDAYLLIRHPAQVTYTGKVNLNTHRVLDCNDVEPTLLQCDIGNPLENSERIHLLLKFKPESDADSLQTMLFSVQATTSSRDLRNQSAIDHKITVVRAADLEIKGNAKPEQVWYGGKVVGASAMQSEADIGQEIQHIYSVINNGPYMVPEFTVQIRWPLEVENNRKSGKYLLYLTEMPRVSVAKQTTACRPLQENSIDPLGLVGGRPALKGVSTEAPTAAASRAEPARSTQKKSTDSPSRRRSSTTTTTTSTEAPSTRDDYEDDYVDYDGGERSTTSRTIYSRKIIHEKNITFQQSSSSSSRMKRDVIVPAESIRVDGRVLNVVSMKCGVNSRCVDFVCTISNLKKLENALVSIRARIWNATFVEDYPKVDRVSIFSSGQIHLNPDIDVRQRADNDYSTAETKAFPDSSLYQRPTGIPWWVIVIGVLLGIMVLIGIIYVLYKCGFFKRRLPHNGKYQTVSQEDKAEMARFDQIPEHHFN